ETLCESAEIDLKAAGFEVDYVDIRNQKSLSLLNNNDSDTAVVVLAAATLGETRLLDNIRVSL
ncbi:MAG: pantoate--beta-alanine ligase, partial [Pseudomonadales bacterium]